MLVLGIEGSTAKQPVWKREEGGFAITEEEVGRLLARFMAIRVTLPFPTYISPLPSSTSPPTSPLRLPNALSHPYVQRGDVYKLPATLFPITEHRVDKQ